MKEQTLSDVVCTLPDGTSKPFGEWTAEDNRITAEYLKETAAICEEVALAHEASLTFLGESGHSSLGAAIREGGATGQRALVLLRRVTDAEGRLAGRIDVGLPVEASGK